MSEQSVEFKQSLTEVFEEVSEDKKIHIKTIGKILLCNGINNIKNINNISEILKDNGVNILKG